MKLSSATLFAAEGFLIRLDWRLRRTRIRRLLKYPLGWIQTEVMRRLDAKLSLPPFPDDGFDKDTGKFRNPAW